MKSRLLAMDVRKAIGLVVLVLTIVLGVLTTLGHSPFTSRQSEKAKDKELAAMLENGTAPAQFDVARVIDGDTFIVKVSGGLATIRVMGINTPETVDPRKPVQCFGPEASARAHVLLDGAKVSLAPDHTQSSLDKYGRVLAYATLPDGTDYNAAMVSEGYAYEYTYKKAYERQKQFRQDQATAKAAAVGLWSPQTCNGKLSL